MNNEIKEILDKLKLLCYDDYCLEFSVDYIERKEEKLLLDYITNLQESDNDKQLEIMKLKDKLEQQRKEYQETYKDVRIEIKEKDETITNLQEENERLKEDKKKAREYIKENQYRLDLDRIKNELLEILGDDNE